MDNLTITPGIDYQKIDQHNHDEYWVGISNPGAGSFLSGTPDRQSDGDRFILPTLKVEWSAGPVKFISNTAWFARLEHVGGYSATIYNLSYFQHFLVPPGAVDQFGNPNVSTYGFPSDPNGNACTNNCQNFYPLLTATGPNLPGMPGYISQNLITNSQRNFRGFRLPVNTPTLAPTVGRRLLLRLPGPSAAPRRSRNPQLRASCCGRKTRSPPGSRTCCPAAMTYIPTALRP